MLTWEAPGAHQRVDLFPGSYSPASRCSRTLGLVTQPPRASVFFLTLVPLIYFHFVFYLFYFAIFLLQSSEQVLKRVGEETGEAGNRI